MGLDKAVNFGRVKYHKLKSNAQLRTVDAVVTVTNGSAIKAIINS